MTVLSDVACYGCKESVPLGDAFRCLNCEMWFHKGCLAIHFGSRDGKPSTDQQRIERLETEVGYWRYRAERREGTGA